ncbi:MAG: hypothetical protein ACJ8EL_09950 [Rhizomicrobium sp.]
MKLIVRDSQTLPESTIDAATRCFDEAGTQYVPYWFDAIKCWSDFTELPYQEEDRYRKRFQAMLRVSDMFA